MPWFLQCCRRIHWFSNRQFLWRCSRCRPLRTCNSQECFPRRWIFFFTIFLSLSSLPWFFKVYAESKIFALPNLGPFGSAAGNVDPECGRDLLTVLGACAFWEDWQWHRTELTFTFYSHFSDPIPSIRGGGLQCCSSWAEEFIFWSLDFFDLCNAFMWNVWTLNRSGIEFWTQVIGILPSFESNSSGSSAFFAVILGGHLFARANDRTATEWHGKMSCLDIVFFYSISCYR